MSQPVTMRMVAEAAGVHQTTVSLALRGQSRIPQATRERIRRVARELGYRVNPLVAALSASRRRRGSGRRATLGYVSADPAPPAGERVDIPYPDLFAGVRARAEELGYGVDHLWLGDPRLTPARFLRIAETRGIHGLVVAPLARKTRTLPVEWGRFAAVAYGYSLQEPDLHRVTPDFYHGMAELLARAAAAGRRRVGLVLDENTDRKADHFWLAAYLAAQHLGPAEGRVAPLRLARWDAAEYARWLRREKPDAIVALDTMLKRIDAAGRRSGGASAGLPRFSLNAAANDARPGNRIDREALGAACVDLVVGMLHRNERGVPARAHNVLVKTIWHAGAEPGAVSFAHR